MAAAPDQLNPLPGAIPASGTFSITGYLNEVLNFFVAVKLKPTAPFVKPGPLFFWWFPPELAGGVVSNEFYGFSPDIGVFTTIGGTFDQQQRDEIARAQTLYKKQEIYNAELQWRSQLPGYTDAVLLDVYRLVRDRQRSIAFLTDKELQALEEGSLRAVTDEISKRGLSTNGVVTDIVGVGLDLYLAGIKHRGQGGGSGGPVPPVLPDPSGGSVSASGFNQFLFAELGALVDPIRPLDAKATNTLVAYLQKLSKPPLSDLASERADP